MSTRTVDRPKPDLGRERECPRRKDLPGGPLAVSVHDRLIHLAIPPTRAALRLLPHPAAKRMVWNRLVGRRLNRHSHRFTARTEFGRKVRGDTREFSEQRIYFCGLFEPYLTRWMSRQLAPGDGFVDVGANIGYFSLLASTLVEGGPIVAIEASPPIFERLRRNLEVNELTNVRAVNAAALDRPTTVRLYGPPTRLATWGASSKTTLLESLGEDLGYEVQAQPLDALLTAEEVSKTRLVKIDVEGVEWAVTAGMNRLIEEGRDDLEVVIEVHARYLESQGRRPEEVCEPFVSAGFHPYELDLDYSVDRHLSPPDAVFARRIDRPFIDRQADIVLSRRDTDVI